MTLVRAQAPEDFSLFIHLIYSSNSLNIFKALIQKDVKLGKLCNLAKKITNYIEHNLGNYSTAQERP